MQIMITFFVCLLDVSTSTVKLNPTLYLLWQYLHWFRFCHFCLEFKSQPCSCCVFFSSHSFWSWQISLGQGINQLKHNVTVSTLNTHTPLQSLLWVLEPCWHCVLYCVWIWKYYWALLSLHSDRHSAVTILSQLWWTQTRGRNIKELKAPFSPKRCL